MARYSLLRRERGESTSIVVVFWTRVAIAVLAMIGISLRSISVAVVETTNADTASREAHRASSAE